MRHARWLGGLALMALLLSSPEAAALGAARAMAQWAASVAPALFPFLALMPLLTCDEAARAYERLLGRPMQSVLGLPGAAASAMVIGMVAGAPAGTIAARKVAARAGMSRGQLQRLAISVSGFSPAFLVSGIGTGMLGDAALGWRLLEAQLLAQLTLALLLRRAWRGRTQPVPAVTDGDEAQPVRAAVIAALTICGYMALFQSATCAAAARVGQGPADALLCLLDVPSGARVIAGLPAAYERVKPLLLAAMCGFGGACVAAQNLGALKGCDINGAEYAGVRVLAAAINVGYMALLTRAGSDGAARLLRQACARPFETAALIAALLALPVLARIRKAIS